jgi:hypothetical protein
VIAYSPPSRRLSIGMRVELSEKELNHLETMSKAGGEFEEPPPQLDEDDNPIIVEVGSKSGISKTPTLEDLMKKL